MDSTTLRRAYDDWESVAHVTAAAMRKKKRAQLPSRALLFCRTSCPESCVRRKDHVNRVSRQNSSCHPWNSFCSHRRSSHEDVRRQHSCWVVLGFTSFYQTKNNVNSMLGCQHYIGPRKTSFFFPFEGFIGLKIAMLERVELELGLSSSR